MRVLITGAAGFIGSHLSHALDARGDEVHGLDLVDGFDALDFFRTDRTRCDLAIHCAAIVGGREHIDGSPLSVATNLALDAWYFRWLQLSGTRRAVYYSSSACYPVDLQNDLARPVALAEGMIRLGSGNLGRPDATYGLAKLAGELLAQEAIAAGIDVLVPRPFSGYSHHQGRSYPFPAIIDRAVRREDPFDVWGDGTQVRDWVHVEDVVAGTLAALEQGVTGPMNLCTGRGTSFRELAGMVIAAVGSGYDPQIRYLTDKPTGVAYRVGDPARMLEVFKPAVDLEEGIERALEAAKR